MPPKRKTANLGKRVRQLVWQLVKATPLWVLIALLVVQLVALGEMRDVKLETAYARWDRGDYREQFREIYFPSAWDGVHSCGLPDGVDASRTMVRHEGVQYGYGIPGDLILLRHPADFPASNAPDGDVCRVGMLGQSTPPEQGYKLPPGAGEPSTLN